MSGLPLHHLYVCAGNSEELKRHLAFRDYLRSHPDAIARYVAIKTEGARQFPHDMDAYIEFKGVFIREILQKAGCLLSVKQQK